MVNSKLFVENNDASNPIITVVLQLNENKLYRHSPDIAMSLRTEK